MLPKNMMQFAKKFIEEQVPFNRLLGMQLDSLEDGRARMQVPFRDEFIGDPFRPALHGGAYFFSFSSRKSTIRLVMNSRCSSFENL